MRRKALFPTLFLTSIWMLLLLAACSSPGDAVPQRSSPPEAQALPAELQVDSDASKLEKPEPAETQEASLPDGSSLLARRCVQCHLVQTLEDTEKTRAEWEGTLSKMESFGVLLEDGEKRALLDYLAGPE
jgi:hypothetical protein